MAALEIKIFTNFLLGCCIEGTILAIPHLGIAFHTNLKCAIIQNSYII